MKPEPVLRVLAGLLFLGGLAYLVGPWVLPDIVRERPFLPHSVVKVIVLGLCCLHGSGWLVRHRPLIGATLLAHLVSIGAMVLYIVALPAAGAMGRDGDGWPVRDVLIGAIVLDGVITLVLLWSWLRARGATRPPTPAPPGPDDGALRRVLVVVGVFFGAATVALVALPFLCPGIAVELPFVSNAGVRTAILALLCFVACRNPRRHAAALDILVVGQLVAVLAGLALLPGSDGSAWFHVGSVELSRRLVLLLVVGVDAVLGLLLLLGAVRAWRRREKLKFLRPVEFRALEALADLLVDVRSPGMPSAGDVARHTDAHLAPIRAAKLWLFRAALFGTQLLPVFRLRPPMSEMEPELRRKDLQQRFGYKPLSELDDDRGRQILQALIRISKQLVYVGYYNDPKVHPSIGYTPFSQRPERDFEDPPGREVSTTKLDVTPADELPDIVATEVCVIGSGAAGSTLAHEFTQAGHRVLLIERGGYTEPSAFTENELDMVGRLYADGITGQTEDFRFTILQGSCVGGGTTINNGVIFDPPAYLLDRWNQEHAAGIDVAELQASVQAMRAHLRVQRQTPYNETGVDPDNASFLNPSGFPFIEALRKHAGALYPDNGAVEANIENNLGTGYENIGDRYGRKLGTLETLLPKAQATGRLTVTAGLDIDRLLTGGGARVREAQGATPGGRRIRVHAERFVIAAGAVASSWLLIRNGIRLGGRVGRGFSANMGSYLTVDFGREVGSEEGLQISHYAIPKPWPEGEPPYVLETWWNPPAIQATNMPGWFEDHQSNMQAYRNMMAVGVIVGTAATGTVRPALTGGAEVVFKPGAQELDRLAAGLRSVAEISIKDGAERGEAVRVMPNTWQYDAFTKLDELDRLDRLVRKSDYLTLGTGHPQGGNAMSSDAGRGVVDPNFRVHGMDNLYVCDASVFPTSVGLNPQMTVFALAHYAARRITDGGGS